MVKRFSVWVVVIVAGIMMMAGHSTAGEASAVHPTKTYWLTDVKPILSNHSECRVFYKDLKQLAKQPINLEFANTKTNGVKRDYAVKEGNSLIQNHTHTTIKQTTSGNAIHRVGLGSFDYRNQTIEYVIDVSANLDNDKHAYLYPAILASHNAHCYYSTLVKPSDDTVAAFKHHVRSGSAARGTDLHQHPKPVK